MRTWLDSLPEWLSGTIGGVAGLAIATVVLLLIGWWVGRR